MASITRSHATVVVGAGQTGGEGWCRHEAGDADIVVVVFVDVIAEEAEDRGYSMEPSEPAAEADVGDEAASALADEGCANEACRVVRRQAEEDLFDELIYQRRCHPCLWRRRHAGDWRACVSFGNGVVRFQVEVLIWLR